MKTQTRKAETNLKKKVESQPSSAAPDLIRRFFNASFSPFPGERPISLDAHLVDAPERDQATACLENHLPDENAGLPISVVDATCHYLCAVARFLDYSGDDFVPVLERQRDAHADATVEGLARLTAEGKPLEELHATVARMLTAAGDSQGKLSQPITFIWVNTDDFMTDEECFRAVSDMIPTDSHLDQDELFSILAFYEPIRSKVTYKRIGKLCEKARALAIIDFGSMEWERVVATFGPGGAFETLSSSDPYHEHVMIVGNRIRVREGSNLLPGDSGTFVNVAPIIAGEMASGDVAPTSCIALPRAGFKRELLLATMDGSPVALEWDIKSNDEADKVRPLNPVVRIKDRLVGWGNFTISTDLLRSQATVVRTEEWFKKCLSSFLQRELFELGGGEVKQRQLRDRIDDFILCHSDPSDDSKPFSGGEVVEIRQSQDNPSHFEVDVRVNFKTPVTKYVVRVMKFVADGTKGPHSARVRHTATLDE